MPVREPQDMPDTMSDRMPDSILDGMREDGPVWMPDNIGMHYLQRMSRCVSFVLLSFFCILVFFCSLCLHSETLIYFEIIHIFLETDVGSGQPQLENSSKVLIFETYQVVKEHKTAASVLISDDVEVHSVQVVE